MNKYFLVIDDEASMRRNILDILKTHNLKLLEAENGLTGIEKIQKYLPEIILLDVNLPDKNGLDVLKEIKTLSPTSTVIVFTAYGTSDKAIKAMKEGAFDYLEKPFELDEFLLLVKRASEYHDLVSEVNELRKIKSPPSPDLGASIISRSSKMQEIFKFIGKLSNNDVPVLIYGESGTGKELIANAIQMHSPRKDKPFIKLNCSSLSENLLESEIFGHEKGSFTGALTQRMGRFELADKGTLFLDEINSMPLSLQVKLLRVLQYGEFERVGGEKTIRVDVRIISATNQNIQKNIEEGSFRKDLFYRLNVVGINIPPLRDRPEDIEPLVHHFIRKYSPNRDIIITDKTLNALQAYNWPGNIRELENLIQRALVVSQSNILDISSEDDIRTVTNNCNSGSRIEHCGFKERVAAFEKEIILEALKAENWNKTKAAQRLKIQRRLLYSKISEHNL